MQPQPRSLHTLLVAAGMPTHLQVTAYYQRLEYFTIQLAGRPAAVHISNNLDAVVFRRREYYDLKTARWSKITKIRIRFTHTRLLTQPNQSTPGSAHLPALAKVNPGQDLGEQLRVAHGAAQVGTAIAVILGGSRYLLLLIVVALETVVPPHNANPVDSAARWAQDQWWGPNPDKQS